MRRLDWYAVRATLLAGWVLIAATSVWPREAAPMADDPALEARVLAIAHELRCLVCQNETIAASSASLALDLREQIRQRLRGGQTPDQIREFMVQRYGQFVLYKPPFESSTWALWIGPFMLFAGALGAFGLALQRRARAPTSGAARMPLSDEERDLVEEALHQAAREQR